MVRLYYCRKSDNFVNKSKNYILPIFQYFRQYLNENNHNRRVYGMFMIEFEKILQNK